ncbi:hypothetical protein ASPACDRAFT_75612 [Aspergillus aculeatus ATCC 16872]|uniref:A-kinase anchor protein 7-like phosphoesterase domain-containing protein n=1 Tax=Aspergillus aculeatus (strain ATCC 16872 / CBS 172.66 / WB 5094) TaxID=690307 RepID=A0A1L9X739_ASPA1|nr:uncharacterized protein ASPACDRAFT_75612 [Aspergillus aculeatus ATCC 16872]OJK04118.1 hypothetical protein ASPACDRAFT_75612 [Aspergillus aculeatus ATCC 16872]
MLVIPVYEGSALQQWVTAYATLGNYLPGGVLGPRNLRPPGTLHLTVGMMTLDTKSRVKAACRFLESLDLDAIRRLADQEAFRQHVGYIPAEPSQQDKPWASSPGTRPRPLTVSFESLVGFPSPEAARHLCTVPVDPTLRLHYFLIYLRRSFHQAGFFWDDHSDEDEISAYRLEDDRPPAEPSSDEELAADSAAADVVEIGSDSSSSSSSVVKSSSSHEESLEDASWLSNPSNAPPPLPPPSYKRGWKIHQIHTTVASTSFRVGDTIIQHSVDVRGLIDHFRDYYLDEEKTMPRCELTMDEQFRWESDVFHDCSMDMMEEEVVEGEDGFEGWHVEESPKTPSEEPTASAQGTSGPPAKLNSFVWAKNVRLESLQLSPGGFYDRCDQSTPVGRARKMMLKVIAQRSLL